MEPDRPLDEWAAEQLGPHPSRGDAYEGPDRFVPKIQASDNGVNLEMPSKIGDFPEPPADAVYYGLAGDLIRMIAPQTEADPVAILVHLLVMFGSAIRRSAHWRIEDDLHYGNLFCVIAGDTSEGRKGVSASRALRCFEAVTDEWSRSCIKSGLSSGEGVIAAVRDAKYSMHHVKQKGRVVDTQMIREDEGVQDKRLLVLESEFGRPLRTMRREGNTLSAVLRDAWDRGNIGSMTKTGLKATDAHISLIGHITPDELKKELGAVEFVNGLANRFLWFMVRRSKLLPLGGQRIDLGQKSHMLALAVENAQQKGEIGLTQAAADVWVQSYYPYLCRQVRGVLGKVLNRGSAQVRRLAMIYALLDFKDAVGPEHLSAALELWRYSERSIQHLFGESTGNRLSDKLLAALRASAPAWMTQTDLHAAVSRKYDSVALAESLRDLKDAGLVVSERLPSSESPTGRQVLRWKAVF